MAPSCNDQSFQFCKQNLLKLIIIVLLIATLVTVLIIGKDSYFSGGDDNHNPDTSEIVNIASESQDASVPSQHLPDWSRDKPWNISTKEHGGGETGRKTDNGHGREVRDLPLMLLQYKLNHSRSGQCLLNFCNFYTEATSRVKSRKAFLYMRKLYLAMVAQTQKADLMEDSSSANWAIRAYAPALRTRHSVLFKRTMDTSCNVTHVELLIGFRCRDKEHRQKDIIAVANGQPVRPSPGIFHIHKAAVFDLTSAAAITELNITVKKRHCISAVQVCHSMLFEFCNINDTVRNLFQENETKISSDDRIKPDDLDNIFEEAHLRQDQEKSRRKEEKDEDQEKTRRKEEKDKDQEKIRRKEEKDKPCVGCDNSTNSKKNENDDDKNNKAEPVNKILFLKKLVSERIIQGKSIFAARLKSGKKPIIIPELEKIRVGNPISLPLPPLVSSERGSLSSSSSSSSPSSISTSTSTSSSQASLPSSSISPSIRSLASKSSAPPWPAMFTTSASKPKSTTLAPSVPKELNSSAISESSRSAYKRFVHKRSVSCGTSCPSTTRAPVRTCYRQEMKVNLFEDLNYPVLMPAHSVDVGMCQGTCIHACQMVQASESITAHAVLLNQLAGIKGAATRFAADIRMSACVPKRMKTMSVLLVEQDPSAPFRTEIVNWPNMVIDSCRCA